MDAFRTDQTTIFAVDDTPSNLRALSDMLLAQGYKVREARDGPTALEALQTGDLPDLILLDIYMPVMDGYTVCKNLKADPRTRDIPVVFVSALSDTENIVRGFEVGGADYIVKPFRFREVLARIASQLTLVQQRRQIEALSTSEKRLQAVLENMPVMLDALDEDLNIIVWNKECERVTGYSADEIIHRPHVSELLYPDLAYRERMQAELTARGDYRNWEWEMTCKDASVKTISWSNLSHQYPIPGWAHWGIGVDVTDRKRAERQLQELNASLEQRVIERTQELNHVNKRIEVILNSSDDVLILCRPDGTIDQINPAFNEMFGYTPENVYGQPLTALVIPENTGLLGQTFETVVQARKPQRVKVNACCQAVAPFDAEIAFSPVMGSDGQLFGVICSLRNITERKQMTAQLRKMLEHAAELSELKSRYVSMAAHDLRNPLAVIRSSLGLLQGYGDRLSDEGKQAKYQDMQSSIAIMESLLDDILTVGQAESGKLTFNPAPVDVVAFCEGLVTEISQAAGAARPITFSSQGNCRAGRVDVKLLRHILGNLLSNALKYSPGDLAVTFGVDCRPDRITFRVQDRGIGIPEADQKRLFETFHRASNVQQIPGTGLGLAIVKQSVELHGGTIAFESQEGVGTTFTVTLPQTSGDEPTG